MNCMPDSVLGAQRHAWLFLCWGYLTWALHGAPPELNHWYPAGAQAGITLEVNSVGESDPWPPQVWCSSPDLTFIPLETANLWQVQIAEQAHPGPVLVRLYNASGASSARWFLIQQSKTVQEEEPNNAPMEANPSPMGSMIHGRLRERQDVDTYALALRANTTLIARMDAYVLGSTVDPLMRLLNRQMQPVAINHDSYYLDPFIAYDVTVTDTYYLQCMGFPYPANASEQLGSGEGYIYQVYVTDGPYLRTADWPEGSHPQTMILDGWNLDSPTTQRAMGLSTPWVDFPTAAQADLINAKGLATEEEPNDDSDHATRISAGSRGSLQSQQDVDWFRWTASKGTHYSVSIQSARLGFQGDLLLKLFDQEDKEILSNDDGIGTVDPMLDWLAPDTAEYQWRLSSRTQPSGTSLPYRLLITPMEPSCRLSLESEIIDLKPGDSKAMTITIERSYGHHSALMLEATGIPAGVSMTSSLIPAEAKEAKIVFHATPSSQPHQGPMRLIARESDNRWRTFPIGRKTITTSVNNGVPNGYLDQVLVSIDDLWISLLPATDQMSDSTE